MGPTSTGSGTYKGAASLAAEGPLCSSLSSSSASATPPSLACSSTSNPCSSFPRHLASGNNGFPKPLSMGSAFGTHPPGTGYPIYQWPSRAPQLGHGQVVSPFVHSSKTRAMQQGTDLDLLSLGIHFCLWDCGQERGQVSQGIKV